MDFTLRIHPIGTVLLATQIAADSIARSGGGARRRHIVCIMHSRGRVGIVTINDEENYGNRLQNYALQEAVRALGWEPETLRNRPGPWDPDLFWPRMRHDLATRPGQIAGRAAEKLGLRKTTRPRFAARRRSAIEQFTGERITASVEEFHTMPAHYWAERYERVIAGSDQVWNPTYRRAGRIDFLDFVDPARRIAYAASFGVNTVPEFLRSRYAAWLRDIPALSVRERTGARLVGELTGRDVPVVADPTALIPTSEWDDLVRDCPLPIADPYAIRYFLGPPTPEQSAWAGSAVAEAGMRTVDAYALDGDRWSDLGPAGFVQAIKNASLVLTDSFHAASFALTYHRPLVLRTRFAGDDRLTTLLTGAGLRTQPVGVRGLDRVVEADWADVDARRDADRAVSLRFLADALDGGIPRPG